MVPPLVHMSPRLFSNSLSRSLAHLGLVLSGIFLTPVLNLPDTLAGPLNTHSTLPLQQSVLYNWSQPSSEIKIRHSDPLPLSTVQEWAHDFRSFNDESWGPLFDGLRGNNLYYLSFSAHGKKGGILGALSRYCISRIRACFRMKLTHRRQRRGSKRN